MNILPYLKGDFSQNLREAVVHHSIRGEFAIRQGPWKLVECRGSGGWSLPEDQVPEDAPPMQLYNMEEDPREQHNLYHEHPEIVERLLNLLNRYREEPRSVIR
ncbi:MAG: hypothetical protein D6820_12670 [Lentisphaerae bacterium]|nr:MAG: hypothetical protein D6820_12670 [Lentisphaerota bacterium]